MVHAVSVVVAEWRTETQLDNDRRLKHPWNSGVVMCASPRERSFSTNPCSPAIPSLIEVG